MQSKLALRGTRINNFVELWCLVASGGLEIWVSQISFQKNNIGCPQQPPAEKMLKSVKIWIFDHLFHKNGPVLVILVPRIIKAADLVIFLMKWGCWGHWGHWGCWGCRGLWGCRGSKAWKITADDFRVNQVLEFALFLMFWNKIYLGRIMKWHVEFEHLSCRRLLRPAEVTFLKTGSWNSNFQTSWSH